MDETKQLAERVADLALARGLKVGAAESLTGGAVTSALSAAPQASEWFRGGLVAYDAEVKYDVLGVEPGPLVSDTCASQMASGAARLLAADIAVATTGVGGPDPEEEQEAGTCHLAVLHDGDLVTGRFCFEGDPEDVVHLATAAALRMLVDALGG